MSPGEPYRICPICRTPNLPTNPTCTQCNFQFFTTRPAVTPTVDEAQFEDFKALSPAGPPPGPTIISRAGPPPPPPLRSAAPRQAAPSQAPAPLAAQPRKAQAKKVRFPKVPKELSDVELEELRYTSMKQSLMLIGLILLLGIVGPPVVHALGVVLPGIGIVGAVELTLVLVFMVYAGRVAKASEKPVSPLEKSARSFVVQGGVVLMLIPIIGSILPNIGPYYFQTNPMHPLYYILAAIGILVTLAGVSGMKERYSYFGVWTFGVNILPLHALPGVFPAISAVFVNPYWFQTTFLFISAGFIVMALALRRMRAGQYETLEREIAAGQAAFERREYERAVANFDRSISIAHSLFSDKLFKTTRAGQRALPPDYYQPWIGKARALALSGRAAKALAIMDLILEVDSGNPDIWNMKGDILLALRRPAEAYIAFEQSLRIQPGQPDIAKRRQQALDFIQRRLE